MLFYHPHPMDPVRINVPAPSRAYSVTIGGGTLDRVGPMLDELGVPARRFVVSSPLVWRLHGPRLAAARSGGTALRGDCSRSGRLYSSVIVHFKENYPQ